MVNVGCYASNWVLNGDVIACQARDGEIRNSLCGNDVGFWDGQASRSVPTIAARQEYSE